MFRITDNEKDKREINNIRDMVVLKNFQLNDEGRYSITRPYESHQVLNYIDNFISCHEISSLSNMTITDATACMGGDLIRFSTAFRFAIGVEIMKDNFICLESNCKFYDCKNTILFNQDYLSIYDTLKQDVIYIDPPWGGLEYKDKETVVLKLGDVFIHDLANKIKTRKLARYLFIKAPMNVCLDNIDYDKIHTIKNKSGAMSFRLICKHII